MFKNFRRFIALPARQRRLHTEALLLLFMAKFLLILLPVKSVLKISFTGKSPEQGLVLNVLLEIKKALHNADRVAFWKNRCLVKSIAGRWMLQRRNIPGFISFGVIRGKDKKLTAHAWLTAEGFEVVEKGGDYLELSAV